MRLFSRRIRVRHSGSLVLRRRRAREQSEAYRQEWVNDFPHRLFFLFHYHYNSCSCSTDKHLIPNLTYDDHLISAHVKSHVFKYTDKSHLFFTCTVQLCFKNDGGCYGITVSYSLHLTVLHNVHERNHPLQPPKCGYGAKAPLPPPQGQGYKPPIYQGPPPQPPIAPPKLQGPYPPRPVALPPQPDRPTAYRPPQPVRSTPYKPPIAPLPRLG